MQRTIDRTFLLEGLSDIAGASNALYNLMQGTVWGSFLAVILCEYAGLCN
eukprot:Gb_32385 [translate_table: standard]